MYFWEIREIVAVASPLVLKRTKVFAVFSLLILPGLELISLNAVQMAFFRSLDRFKEETSFWFFFFFFDNIYFWNKLLMLEKKKLGKILCEVFIYS